MIYNRIVPLFLLLTFCSYVEVFGRGETSIPQISVSQNRLPNIILIMSDDQGWGDVGYNARGVFSDEASPSRAQNVTPLTPHLDRMAREGVRFNRFYTSPVCSPTRFSVLTGRSPYRNGMIKAAESHIFPKEITLAEALKTKGYVTGHFGKWHLGTLVKSNQEIIDGQRGGRSEHDIHYSPPWENGYQYGSSTENLVPTFNPMRRPGHSHPTSFSSHSFYGNAYWKYPPTPGSRINVKSAELRGDDSRIIMNQVFDFLERQESEQPFFLTIWFHTPHNPVVDARSHYNNLRSVDYLRDDKGNRLYPRGSRATKYHYVISAMDQQIGFLRDWLSEKGMSENSLIWFSSDNGPYPPDRGSRGGLRGWKKEVYEGGIRTPSLLVWPKQVRNGAVIDIPVSSNDIYPTILDVIGFDMEGQMPLDGVSVKSIVTGERANRNVGIGISYKHIPNKLERYAWIKDDYKLIWLNTDNNRNDYVVPDIDNQNENGKYQVYNIKLDPRERNDLSENQSIASIKNQLINEFHNWFRSVLADFDLNDLNNTDSYKSGYSNYDDIDGDGWIHATEFYAGTDPFSDSSYPKDQEIQETVISNPIWERECTAENDSHHYDVVAYPRPGFSRCRPFLKFNITSLNTSKSVIDAQLRLERRAEGHNRENVPSLMIARVLGRWDNNNPARFDLKIDRELQFEVFGRNDTLFFERGEYIYRNINVSERLKSRYKYIDVSEIVRSWHRKEKPNYGFRIWLTQDPGWTTRLVKFNKVKAKLIIKQL